MFVILGKREAGDQRRQIDNTGLDAAPVVARDADFSTAKSIVLDASAITFPVASLADVPPGDYYVQAAFRCNRDLLLVRAPGNLYSDVRKLSIDPARDETISLTLSKMDADEKPPADTDRVKYIRLESPLLSKFHGRPMFLRAALVLPESFGDEGERKHPLRVTIGGFGSRCYGMARFAGVRGGDAPLLHLFLDGAGPLGDPYWVNSDNNGPYGDALTQELIPYVEKTYRGIGEARARVLDGGSTGGWVSLALQVFYPDYFNGCWSGYPDGVDFRAYELINIYEDENAYVNRFGFERPSKRIQSGEVEYTVRHECAMENMLGMGDSWTLSGQQWGSWNAVYGPRGTNGLPVPLWDPKTGKIDHSVVEHWKKYDLRLVLQSNWATLGPKLRGKLHVWVGEADDYFLDGGVHLLDEFLSHATPPYEGWIKYGPRMGHGWSPLKDEEIVKEMLERTTKP